MDTWILLDTCILVVLHFWILRDTSVLHILTLRQCTYAIQYADTPTPRRSHVRLIARGRDGEGRGGPGGPSRGSELGWCWDSAGMVLPGKVLRGCLEGA